MISEFFKLNRNVELKELRTCYYQELPSDYWCEGERHDFWEVVYVEKGAIAGYLDKSLHQLVQGELLIIEPNAFHNLWVTNNKQANIINISFQMNLTGINNFNRRTLLNSFQREIFKRFIEETKKTFNGGLDKLGTMDYFSNKKNDNNLELENESLLANYLEILVIELLREMKKEKNTNHNDDILDNILNFMYQNIDKKLSLSDFACEFHMSESNIKRIFNKRVKCGPSEYFRNLKIAQAKLLMKEKNLNITEVSNALGYSSVHHFSKQFKKITGVSPSDYIKLEDITLLTL